MASRGPRRECHGPKRRTKTAHPHMARRTWLLELECGHEVVRPRRRAWIGGKPTPPDWVPHWVYCERCRDEHREPPQ